MHTVLDAWAISCEILNREQLPVWFRGSLNMALRTTRVLIVHWRGILKIFCMQLAVAFFGSKAIATYEKMGAMVGKFGFFFFEAILLLFVLLTLRPSVQRKDAAYFISYFEFRRMIVAFSFLFSFYFLLESILKFFPTNFFFVFVLGGNCIFLIIFFLFYFDVPGDIKNCIFALCAAARCIWYNFPIIFLFNCCCALLLWPLGFLTSLVAPIMAESTYYLLCLGVSLFAIPFLLAPLVFLYVKSVNQNYGLYYE